MDKRTYRTSKGSIAYRISDPKDDQRPWLVFLPGLTADHTLFEKQIDRFEGDANVFAWDAPSHGESRPFDLDWTLDDVARWLREILDFEGITEPILIGQSLGGYIAQAYMDLYPGSVRGFVSIDSCPLKRSYYQAWELAALKHTKFMFRCFPWKAMQNLAATNNSTTEYGQHVMRDIMRAYDKREYCDLSAYGFRVLAEAVEADRPYDIDCPVLLICGEKDGAGSAKRYNRAWEKRAGHTVHWVEGAGHNSNCDAPDVVNALIAQFVGEHASEAR